MTIKIKEPYSPAEFFTQVEKYSNDSNPLEIIFPDDCSDAFSTIFNLNGLLNVQKIEVPWNFGANDICKNSTDAIHKKDVSNEEKDVSDLLVFTKDFHDIYFNNLRLLEISADEIIKKNINFVMENKEYANNLMKTVLTLPFPPTLKEIAFRPCPENKTPPFKFKEGSIISFDGKFVYKKLTV